MMKTTLLSTVAALALAIGLGAASAQAPSGTERGGATSGTMERGGAAGDHKSGMSEQSPSKAGTSGQQAQSPAAPNKTDGRAEGKNAPEGKTATDKNAQAPAADSKGDKGSKAAQSPSSKSTVGAAPSSETKLTTEQRTQIREKVLATGPKETKVSFSLNVGTVVPRTVHVAEVPTVILDIHPEWRGYRYFIVNDQIIIVEREALRIVAILDV